MIFNSNKPLHSIPKYFLIIIVIIITILQFSPTNQFSSLMKNVIFFEDQICSYAGNFKSDSHNYTCECKNEYYSSLLSTSKILSVQIQCDKLRKRKNIALLFSIVFPFGTHLIYMEYFIYGVLYILLCCISTIGNCVRYYIFSFEDSYFRNKLNLGFFLLLILMIITHIVNVILLFNNSIPDSYGEILYDDFDYFYESFKKN